MKKYLQLVFFICISITCTDAQVVSTFAGTATATGNTNGTGAAARFNGPHGITADKAGNIYVADRFNNLIRKIAPSGVVTTLAGNGTVGSTDGAGATATFNEPWGIAADTLGNLYVADTKNYKIRKIDATGTVSTIAGTGVFGTTNGPANVSRFGFSTGITVTPDGNTIYVADYNTHVIRKIAAGTVTTFAGTIFIAGSANGSGTAATFNHPYSVELDLNGNVIVGDEWNNIIRKISPAAVVTTFAGQGIVGSADGGSLAAQFNYPWDIAVDSLNNIFIMDGYNFTIRKIDHTTNAVTTYVGTAGIAGSADGVGAAAKFDNAAGITFNRYDKCLYVADCNNHTIRKVSAQSNINITLTVTGNTSVCFGDSIKFNAAPAGLSNYTIKEGSTILGSSTNGSVAIPALAAGSHTLVCTALDGNGATASSNTVNVTVLPVFVPTVSSANNATSFCTSDSLLLTAQSGTSYLWSNGKVAQNIYVTAAGSYTVTVTNSSGCKGNSAAFAVSLLAAPAATISSTLTNVCPGDSLQLNASAGSSWLWSTGATTQNILVPAGTYSVTVSAANGCKTKSGNATYTNYSLTPAVVSPSGTITIVQGDSTQLTASGGSNYSWSNSQSGNSIYANMSGFYSASYTTANGCVVTSNVVQVIVISSNSLMTAGGATSFCEGNNVVLSSFYPTGNQWFFNGAAITGAISQQYTVVDSGYYKVGNYQNGNWLYSDSLLVKVYSSPQLAVVSDTSICRGESVLLNAQTEPGITYQWFDDISNGNILSSQSSYQTASLDQSITYYVEAKSPNGCASVGRSALNITIAPTPVPAFNTSIQVQNGQYLVTYSNQTTNATSYTWIFGDTSIAGNLLTDVNPQYAYPSVGIYNVMLIATNTNGCADTLSRTVEVHNNNDLFIPTTFTPNNDGKNDLFRVRGDGFEFLDMMIYDQWGTLIYKADQAKPNWDGRVNGTVVQNGTYVYRIHIIDKDNASRELKGSLTVIK